MRRASLVGLAGAVVAASAAGSALAAPPWSEPRSIGAPTAGRVGRGDRLRAGRHRAAEPPDQRRRGGAARTRAIASRRCTPDGTARRAPAAAGPSRRSPAGVRAGARRAPPGAAALRAGRHTAACSPQPFGGFDRTAGGSRPAAPAGELHDASRAVGPAGDGGRPAGSRSRSCGWTYRRPTSPGPGGSACAWRSAGRTAASTARGRWRPGPPEPRRRRPSPRCRAWRSGARRRRRSWRTAPLAAGRQGPQRSVAAAASAAPQVLGPARRARRSRGARSRTGRAVVAWGTPGRRRGGQRRHTIVRAAVRAPGAARFGPTQVTRPR